LRRYRKGTVLIEEGDRGETIFIILAGRLRAYAASDKGREITYGLYGPGGYIGEMSLDGGPRSASVVTLEPSFCSVVTPGTLRQHIADEPGFAFELIGKIIRRARAATVSAKQLALNDVYGRLVAMLNELAIGGFIEERLTHQDIAARLGCSREMVSRLMSDLERGGYLEATRQGIWLRKRLPDRW
jgi:CRP/FNR family cyclic AMP-dependent transcriptional regulator